MLKKKINQKHQQDNFMIGIISTNKFLVIALAMVSCGSATQEREPIILMDNKKIITETNPKENESVLKDYEKVFIYEDNTVKQTLGVNYKGENLIEFTLNFEKKDGSCKVNVQGVAKNKNENLDPELDEDEEGIAYPSNEFIYEKGKCIIALRIAMKEKDKAIIRTFGCNTACYPETTSLLRLMK